MSSKPKIAFYWCASCGGCEEAVVDLAEEIIGVLNAIDIVLWPVAMDFKKHDIEALADGEITATLLNGAIRTSEQEEMAELLRRKSKYLIAYGACAQLGGIPGLANMIDRETILRRIYDEDQRPSSPGTSPSTAATPAAGDAIRPRPAYWNNGHMLTLPTFRDGVRALDQVVVVDYYVPGCPPTPKLTRSALDALLSGNLPPRGMVLAPDIALCDECPRRASKPTDLSFDALRRPHQVALDADRCLLAQGIVCMGPATRGGCGAVCLAGNMPCTGCFGPSSRVRDQGAKMLSSLCGAVAAKEPEAITTVLDGLPDPVGTFYRYGLAKSLLRRRTSRPLATDTPSRGPVATESEAVAAHPTAMEEKA